MKFKRVGFTIINWRWQFIEALKAILAISFENEERLDAFINENRLMVQQSGYSIKKITSSVSHVAIIYYCPVFKTRNEWKIVGYDYWLQFLKTQYPASFDYKKVEILNYATFYGRLKLDYYLPVKRFLYLSFTNVYYILGTGSLKLFEFSRLCLTSIKKLSFFKPKENVLPLKENENIPSPEPTQRYVMLSPSWLLHYKNSLAPWQTPRTVQTDTAKIKKAASH